MNRKKLLDSIRLLNRPGVVNHNGLLDKLEKLNSLRSNIQHYV